MSHTDSQEQAILDAEFGLASATIPVGSHLVLCTAAPEDGTTGVSAATPLAFSSWQRQGAQVNNRHRVISTAGAVLANTTAGQLVVSHIGWRVGAAGSVINYMTLGGDTPTTVTLDAGEELSFAAGELNFDLG
ncbi:MAG: hypothetical protein AAFU79_14895 [Myxococcota bacterium]